MRIDRDVGKNLLRVLPIAKGLQSARKYAGDFAPAGRIDGHAEPTVSSTMKPGSCDDCGRYSRVVDEGANRKNDTSGGGCGLGCMMVVLFVVLVGIAIVLARCGR